MDSLIHQMLRGSATRYPDKEAIVHARQRLTYREVANRCTSVACGLRSAGMRRSDRVGIYLDPSVDQVVSMFSISQAGGVYVPVNTVLFPEQVAHIVRDCAMTALITTPEKLERRLVNCRDARRRPAGTSLLRDVEAARRRELAGLGYLEGLGGYPLHLRFHGQAQRRHA